MSTISSPARNEIATATACFIRMTLATAMMVFAGAQAEETEGEALASKIEVALKAESGELDWAEVNAALEKDPKLAANEEVVKEVKEAWPDLMTLVLSKDYKVAGPAARFAGRFPSLLLPSLPTLLEHPGPPDPRLKGPPRGHTNVLLVNEFLPMAPVEELLALLDDEEEEIRLYAAWALGERRGIDLATRERFIAELIGLLDDPSRAVQAQAARVLGSYGQDAQAAVAPLARFVAASDLTGEKLVPRFMQYLGPTYSYLKPGPKIRSHDWSDNGGILALHAPTEQAVAALAKIGRGAEAEVLKATRDERPEVRLAATRALWTMGMEMAPGADGRLIELTGDPDLPVRRMAVRALGSRPVSPDSVEAISNALSGPEESVVGVAMAAMDELQASTLPESGRVFPGEAETERVRALMRSENQWLVRAAVRSLDVMVRKKVITAEELEGYLRSELDRKPLAPHDAELVEAYLDLGVLKTVDAQIEFLSGRISAQIEQQGSVDEELVAVLSRRVAEWKRDRKRDRETWNTKAEQLLPLIPLMRRLLVLEKPSGRSFWILGSMGAHARDLLPDLRELLEREGLDPDVRDAAEEAIHRIQKELEEGTEE